MRTAITIRIDPRLRARLEERAAASGRTLSELVREVLESAVEERLLGSRTCHLAGRLELPRRDDDPWRKQLRQRNWRS